MVNNTHSNTKVRIVIGKVLVFSYGEFYYLFEYKNVHCSDCYKVVTKFSIHKILHRIRKSSITALIENLVFSCALRRPLFARVVNQTFHWNILSLSDTSIVDIVRSSWKCRRISSSSSAAYKRSLPASLVRLWTPSVSRIRRYSSLNTETSSSRLLGKRVRYLRAAEALLPQYGYTVFWNFSVKAIKIII